jgi:sulfur-oxidizing protein SoxB
MNISKRDFLQVLGAGAAAGMGLGRWAQADAADAGQALYEHPALRQCVFSAHDRLPRAD